MAGTQLFSYKGNTIFKIDFSNVSSVPEISGIINEGAGYIRNQPLDSVLTLTDISGMHFNNEIKELFQNFIKGNKPYVKAGAVIGLNGLQQIIYNGLMKLTGREIKSFSSIESAKDWLVEKS